MREHGFVFEVRTTEAEELTGSALGPVKLVEENARIKAVPVAQMCPDCVVIGADTVVAFDSKVLGKPADMKEAAEMLEMLNGKEHCVHTGVCIVHHKTGRTAVFVETTRVRFHCLTMDERLAYHRRINPLDKAGAYAAQDDDGRLIAETEGSFSNVVGLPMEALKRHLNEFGFPLA